MMTKFLIIIKYMIDNTNVTIHNIKYKHVKGIGLGKLHSPTLATI